MGDPPQISTSPEAGAAGRLRRSAALAEGLPAAFAAAVLDPGDPALAGVFMAGSQGTRLRTGTLPAPMRREITWWMATCQASGERQIHASEWNRWAATAADVVARRPQVCSFADLTLGEWMTAWGRVFHGEHGRMASAASRARAEIALRPLVGRLAIRYSDAAWWQHDTWSLKLDPRIPRRPHETRGNTAIRWQQLEAGLAAAGFQVLPAPAAGIGTADLVLGDATARLRVPVRGVPRLPRHRPSGADRRSRPGAAGSCPGVPDLPARLGQDTAGPGESPGQRRPEHAVDHPQPAGHRPVLPGDERLPGRGRRRARR